MKRYEISILVEVCNEEGVIYAASGGSGAMSVADALAELIEPAFNSAVSGFIGVEAVDVIQLDEDEEELE